MSVERLEEIADTFQSERFPDLAEKEKVIRNAAAVIRAAEEFINDSYRPEPKYDAMRFDNLSEALAAFNQDER